MLAELRTQHRQLARLKHEGYKAPEIASQMDMPLSTVRNILADPLFKSHVASLDDASDEKVIDARKVLADGAVMAAQKVVELVNSYDEKLGLSAARDVLDRTGYSPKQEYQHKHLHAHLSSEDIEALKSRAKQAGAVVSEDYEPALEVDFQSCSTDEQTEEQTS